MRRSGSIPGIRRFVAIMLAIALLFAPAFTHIGMASAASPNHAQMMEQSGHCQMPPAGSVGHGKPVSKNCCVASCIAVAPEVAASDEESIVVRENPVLPVMTFHLAYLGEIATPPPRLL